MAFNFNSRNLFMRWNQNNNTEKTNGLKVVEVWNLNHFVCKREADGRLRDKYDYQLKGTYTDKN